MIITDSIIKDSDGWDGDLECIQLYNGTLQIDTAKFHKGDKINTAEFDYEKSKLVLYNEEDAKNGVPTEILDLILSVATISPAVVC